MNIDLQTREIAYDAKTASLPSVGEQAHKIAKTDEGVYKVTATGWHEYNTIADETHSYEAERILSWCLGISHNRSLFHAREIYITHARAKTKKQLCEVAGIEAEAESLVITTEMTSRLFPVPDTVKNCIQIIIDGGHVLTAIRTVP